MSENSKTSALERLNSMSRQQLQKMVIDSAKKLGESKKQNRQKDRLIADITSQREKAQKEADKILNTAKAQAAAIREKARAREEEAERQLDDVTAEVARKLTNANTEADSIVKSKLSEAKSDIEEFERKREESKRRALDLNNNILDRYDGLITRVEEQISMFKDIKQDIRDFNAEIESEDFKKFNMSDYISAIDDDDDFIAEEIKESKPVKARRHVKPSVKPILDVENDDTTLGDDDLEALAKVFDDDFMDDVEEEPVGDIDDANLLSDDDLGFLESIGVTELSDDLADIDGDLAESDLEYEDIDIDDDDVFESQDMKSFTSSFMAVSAAQQVEDDDEGDFDDFALESILEGDAMAAASEDEFSKPSPKVAIPARHSTRRANSSAPGRWRS